MRKLLTRFLLFVFPASVFLFQLSCDRGVEPPNHVENTDTLSVPVFVYVSNFNNQWLYMLDAETWKVESLDVGGSQYFLKYDRFTKRIYGSSSFSDYTQPGSPRVIKIFVIDALSRTLIPSPLNQLTIPNRPDLDLSWDGTILVINYPYRDTTWTVFVSTPSGQILRRVYEVGNSKSSIGTVHNSQYALFYSPDILREILAYNFQSFTINARYSLRAQGKRFVPRIMKLHPNGKVLYFTSIAEFDVGQDSITPGPSAGNWLVELNLETSVVKPWRQILHFRAKLALTFDGKYLAQTEPGCGCGIPFSEDIFVYDTQTGGLIDTVSTKGVYQYNLRQDALAITNDSKYLFVAPGGDGAGSGPLLVVDFQERKVVKKIQVGAENLTTPIALLIVPK